jgi:hypothetical protein
VQQPSEAPRSIDGRRAESIFERTAAYGDMSEADVRSRLQVLDISGFAAVY